MGNTITKEQIIKIASLAKLKLNDFELAKYTIEFNSILDYISILENCDVSDVDSKHNLSNYRSWTLEEDEIKNYKTTKEELLKNATNGRTKNGYIVTRKSTLLDE